MARCRDGLTASDSCLAADPAPQQQSFSYCQGAIASLKYADNPYKVIILSVPNSLYCLWHYVGETGSVLIKIAQVGIIDEGIG